MAEVLEKLKEPENMQEYEEDTQKDKYLTFVIGKEVYGIEIKFVTEIIGIQPITQVPELPNYVKGIINLRGKIVPVIDVRLRFKKEPRDYNDRTCIVVIDIKEISVWLIVDSVAEVVDISEEDIVPPPNTNTGFNNRYIKGIGKMDEQVKLIIDCNEFLDDKQCDNLIDIG